MDTFDDANYVIYDNGSVDCKLCDMYTNGSANSSAGHLSPGFDQLGIPYNKTDPNMLEFRALIHAIDIYVLPIILLFGIFGNLISFCVFMFTYMRQMSSCIYLSGLCLSDIGFLICALASWSDNINFRIYHRQGSCQIFVFLTYVTSFLSVWYVVGFSLERYLAIKFPFKRQELCTTKRAKIVTIALAVTACIMYTFALWTSGVIQLYGGPYCHPLPKYYNLVHAISNADTTITLIIPTILILWSNTQIAYVLAKFYRTRATLGQQQTSQRPVSVRNQAPNSSSSSGDTSVIYADTSYNRSQMKVTRMLLTVSTVFLLCHMPSHALRVTVFIFSLVNPKYEPSHMLLLIQKFLNFLYYLNFAVNFILYAISGKTFRKALRRLCLRIKRSMTTYAQKSGSTIRLLRRPSTRLQNVMEQVEENANVIEQRNLAPRQSARTSTPFKNRDFMEVGNNAANDRKELIKVISKPQAMKYLNNQNYD